jgi:dTDP-4-dehydrorhamnose 3,5-epimerase
VKPVLLPNTGHVDSRGQFQRIFDKQTIGLKNLELQQVNISKNPLAQTLRGMHFQVAGPPEHKFITVLSGTIYLVVSNAHIVSKKNEVENHYFQLSEDISETLFVPSGLATGWISLSNNVVISYLMTSRFQECDYSGFLFDDPFANIHWLSSPKVISSKDRSWQLM